MSFLRESLCAVEFFSEKGLQKAVKCGIINSVSRCIKLVQRFPVYRAGSHAACSVRNFLRIRHYAERIKTRSETRLWQVLIFVRAVPFSGLP